MYELCVVSAALLSLLYGRNDGDVLARGFPSRAMAVFACRVIWQAAILSFAYCMICQAFVFLFCQRHLYAASPPHHDGDLPGVRKPPAHDHQCYWQYERHPAHT
jgi:hypothetical protein